MLLQIVVLHLCLWLISILLYIGRLTCWPFQWSPHHLGQVCSSLFSQNFHLFLGEEWFLFYKGGAHQTSEMHLENHGQGWYPEQSLVHVYCVFPSSHLFPQEASITVAAFG